MNTRPLNIKCAGGCDVISAILFYFYGNIQKLKKTEINSKCIKLPGAATGDFFLSQSTH